MIFFSCLWTSRTGSLIVPLKLYCVPASLGSPSWGMTALTSKTPCDLLRYLPLSCDSTSGKIGRAHVLPPVPNAHLVCRLLLDIHNHDPFTYVSHFAARADEAVSIVPV